MAKGKIPIHEWTKETEEGSGFELLPKGNYPCFVYDMTAGESENNNPKAEVVLKIAKGEHKGRQLWVNLTFTKKAWWKVVEFLKAVGIDPENDLPKDVKDQYELVASIKEDILGSKVIAQVGHRKWQGEDREDVKKVLKPKEDFDAEIDEGTAEDGADEVPF